MDNSQEDSERTQAEEKLRLQALLLNAVGQAVVATDLESRIVYWNQTAEELYGWSAEAAMGGSLRELVASEDFGKRAKEIWTELRAGRSWSGEIEVRRKDGNSLEVLGTATPVYDDRGDLVGMISVSMDITDRKRMEQQLLHQALHDPLTGLANRCLLEDRLRQALARAQRRESQVAVMYMDLDNFKIVNDSLGHERPRKSWGRRAPIHIFRRSPNSCPGLQKHGGEPASARMGLPEEEGESRVE